MWGGAKSAIKPVSQQTRTERIAAPKPPPPLPSRLASNSKSVKKAQDSKRSSPAHLQNHTRSPATPDRLDVPSVKRKTSRQRSPGEIKPNFGDDSDDDDDVRSRSSVGSSKRQKMDSLTPAIDTKRKLRSKRGFSQDDGEFPMTHAADVASSVRRSKLPDLQADQVTVELKYPSASQRERCVIFHGLRWRG